MSARHDFPLHYAMERLNPTFPSALDKLDWALDEISRLQAEVASWQGLAHAAVGLMHADAVSCPDCGSDDPARRDLSDRVLVDCVRPCTNDEFHGPDGRCSYVGPYNLRCILAEGHDDAHDTTEVAP